MNNSKEIYNNEYLPQIIRRGRITGVLGVLFSFAPAIVLVVVFKILPPPAALLTAFISIASAVGILWIVEPISYFPVIGVAGTYMAFLSGNISNMRIPCATVAQDSAGVEPGTDEGSIISTLGMAVSIIINTSVLSIGVILGSSILAKLPPSVIETLNYLLPALFGALFVQFALKSKKIAPIALAIGLAFSIGISLGFFNWLPGASNYLATLGTVFLSIFITNNLYKKQKNASKGASGNE